MSRTNTHIARSANSKASDDWTSHLFSCVAAIGSEQLQDFQVVETLLDTPDAKRAQRILAETGSLLALATMGPIELQVLGLSWQESARMMVLLEAVKRVMRRPLLRRISNTADLAADLCLRTRGLSMTVFGLLGLNSRMEVLLDKPISRRETCDTHPRAADMFREALKSGVSRIIVWHNHLNGDPIPTPEDLSWTEELRMIGDVLHVSLVDHLILGDGCYYSLRIGMEWQP